MVDYFLFARHSAGIRIDEVGSHLDSYQILFPAPKFEHCCPPIAQIVRATNRSCSRNHAWAGAVVAAV